MSSLPKGRKRGVHEAMAYLDNSATTRTDPEVIRVMVDVMEKVYGKDKLRKLSARRIVVETGTPDPKISVPDFVDAPAKK